MLYSYDRRTASAGTLFDAKIEWAYQLASAIGMHVEGGGWRGHRLKSRVTKTGRSVEFVADSAIHGFSLTAFISVEGQPEVLAMFTKHKPQSDNIDLLQVQQEIHDTSHKFTVGDHEPMANVVKAVSLFYSKFVNQIPQ
jgi:hypothetical protein